MSDKWRRSKAWDDEHLPPAFLPVKFLLRAFSSITLAVFLLSFVVLYGVSASVPVGLLALVPTVLLYGLTLVVSVGLVVGGVLWLGGKLLRNAGRGARFAVLFLSALVLAPVTIVLWYQFVWPVLQYDPATGRGVRLFPEFVKAYSAITLRRLPGMEMSELEYYSWWPLRVVLLLFIVNMMTATVRRIEFTFKNIGVLTVHTGIILIALGSIYYSGLKREGDTILLAGSPDPESGKPGVGPPQGAFYDNTRVALYLDQGRGWEQRLLENVPRYNDYNLDADSGDTASEVTSRRDVPPSRSALDIPVRNSSPGAADDDVALRVVGYASYADSTPDWLRIGAADSPNAATRANPLRIVYLHSATESPSGDVLGNPIFAFTLPPLMAAERSTGNGVFSVEYTLGASGGMPASRWRDLTEPLPPDTRHALAVEVPGAEGSPAFRAVYPVRQGQHVQVGDTGYSLSVQQLSPEPPFPIITEGYRGARSSVAVVKVTTPAAGTFERWVYHRFPEISQDMLERLNERGMPMRRDADPSIHISLIEADQLHIYFDEPEPGGGRVRAIIRQPGGELRTVEELGPEGLLPHLVPRRSGDDPIITMRVGERWENAERIDRPSPTPSEEQDKSKVGTHDNAMLAVEVSVPGDSAWRRIVWLPFTRYMGMGMGTERTVALPDGRRLRLAFGRLQHQIPGFEISLVDFQMIAYDHRGAPRDYQSVLRVTPVDLNFEGFEHVTKLNAPLTAPFMWRDDRAWISNAAGRLSAGLNPFQFKFSQAGWDAQGWEQTQRQADAGLLPRPFVKFTILGVGNSPGIHIIALGAVLMAVGIPWAFYLKPWLVKREKRRIQAQVAAGTYVKPQRPERVTVGAGAAV